MTPAPIESGAANPGDLRAEAGRFTAESEAALLRLRRAFVGVLGSSPIPLQRATDLQRLLGVEASLGWQVFRLAGTDDPLGAVSFVPTPGSMAKVLRIMRERGFDAGALDEAGAAYAQFESVVEHHALDRESFDRMIAALRNEPDDLIELGDRRGAFRANSRIWGVQTRVLYRCAFIYPARDPATFDSAWIRGCAGLRQLRPVPSVTLAKRTLISGGRRLENAELDQPAAAVTVLEEFCTTPTPRIEVVHGQNSSRDTVRIEGIGRDAVVDCFLNDVHADTGRPWAAEKTWGAFVTVNLPCELLVCDLLTPKGWSIPSTAMTAVSGNVSDHQCAEDDPESYFLPVTEKIEHLGTDLDALCAPALPRCAEMARTVLERIGASRLTFDIYRCQVRFPILNSSLLMEIQAGAGS